MLHFIKENLSTVTKMIVNQFGMMIFGLVMHMATAQNDTLFLLGPLYFPYAFIFFLNILLLGRSVPVIRSNLTAAA